MNQTYSRREMLRLTGRALLAGAFAPQLCRAGEGRPAERPAGVVTGDPDGKRVGEKVLADGGNAIDAIIAAALTTCVVANSKCGVGGYGGHMMIAMAKSRKVVCIDYNSMAPAAAKPDMFPVNAQEKAIGGINSIGWLAVGVPGTMAGIQLALDKYGTKPFRELVAPAIALAQDGFPLSRSLAGAIRSTAPQLKKFPGSAKLLLKENGEPYKEGEIFRNPDLAALLIKLAKDNSVESFYRGEIAKQIAAEFKKNGGLVTEQDLADYHAHEVKPLKLDWGDHTIHTAPLTAGGLTVLQALSILEQMKWAKQPAGFEKSHARLEALRVAWRDRLLLLGDPEQAKVPVDHLLSASYGRKVARDVMQAVREKHPLPLNAKKEQDDGTMNLSCVDREGNMVAMTLTHGSAFGSKVTVEGLGLVLGHGMVRFDPVAGRPNSPGPKKRPLHNMCPTVVTRDGHAALALGAAGGRMIPDSIFDALANYLALGKTMAEAVAAPRMNTEGDLNLHLEKTWPAEEIEAFKGLGYKMFTSGGAYLSAVSFDRKTGACEGAER